MGKIFKKKEIVKTKNNVKSLEFGDELRLVMKDYSRRVVTVMYPRQSGMRVKELFHGVYDLAYDDIMFAYIGDDIYTPSQLRQSALIHMEKIVGHPIAM